MSFESFQPESTSAPEPEIKQDQVEDIPKVPNKRGGFFKKLALYGALAAGTAVGTGCDSKESRPEKSQTPSQETKQVEQESKLRKIIDNEADLKKFLYEEFNGGIYEKEGVMYIRGRVSMVKVDGKEVPPSTTAYYALDKEKFEELLRYAQKWSGIHPEDDPKLKDFSSRSKEMKLEARKRSLAMQVEVFLRVYTTHINSLEDLPDNLIQGQVKPNYPKRIDPSSSGTRGNDYGSVRDW